MRLLLCPHCNQVVEFDWQVPFVCPKCGGKSCYDEQDDGDGGDLMFLTPCDDGCE